MPYDRAGAMHRGTPPRALVGQCAAATSAAAGLAAMGRQGKQPGGSPSQPGASPFQALAVPRASVLGLGTPGADLVKMQDEVNSGFGLMPRIVFEVRSLCARQERNATFVLCAGSKD